VPHHGSKTSSTEPFLDSIEPLVAVFQVGYRNRFHHPNPGVFERYLGRHIELTRSDTDGAVQIMAAGNRAQGNLAAVNRAQGTLPAGTHAHSDPAQDAPSPPATLALERYRTAHHRYWMDR
jgi:competence protein ComEC